MWFISGGGGISLTYIKFVFIKKLLCGPCCLHVKPIDIDRANREGGGQYWVQGRVGGLRAGYLAWSSVFLLFVFYRIISQSGDDFVGFMVVGGRLVKSTGVVYLVSSCPGPSRACLHTLIKAIKSARLNSLWILFYLYVKLGGRHRAKMKVNWWYRGQSEMFECR